MQGPPVYKLEFRNSTIETRRDNVRDAKSYSVKP